MYLNKKHFESILLNQGFDIKQLHHFERLSSKAVLFSTGTTAIIIYVNTIVFHRIDNQIKLNTSGWKTITTKKWINYGLGNFTNNDIHIYQKNFIWYLVQNDDEPIEFYDNMIIHLQF